MRAKKRIGVIGAGQLARMMVPAAIELDLDLSILAIDDQESAAKIWPKVSFGHHSDKEAVLNFAKDVDVITFDHEHVPAEILHELEARQIEVHPSPNALIYAQDKLLMRKKLSELSLPNVRWWEITNSAELESALTAAGGELVVKLPRGGYDGKGVRVVRAVSEVEDWLAAGHRLLAEEKVPFVRELSAQVARNASGEFATYPVVESKQVNGVCYLVVAPAPKMDQEKQRKIQSLAAKIATDLAVVGMLAVELFEYPNGEVAVNELAMRPHNTGHWSMDGAITSQFEQHLRAVANLPLGNTAPKAETVMVNLLGASRQNLHAGVESALFADPEIKIHLYGKTVRAGRKLGHVNLVGNGLDTTEVQKARAEKAAETIVKKENHEPA